MVRSYFPILSYGIRFINNQGESPNNVCEHIQLRIYTPIVHVHLFTEDGLVIIFSQDSSKLGPISGKVDPRENFETTGRREVYEETGIEIYDPTPTNHYFSTISPKGKPIFGRTFFAVLPSCWKTWLLSSQFFPRLLRLARLGTP